MEVISAFTWKYNLVGKSITPFVEEAQISEKKKNVKKMPTIIGNFLLIIVHLMI